MDVRRSTRRMALPLCLAAALASPAQAGRKLDPIREWSPPAAAELAQPASKVEPGAHAEYLLFEEFIEDGRQATARDVHVRLKVFDAAGAQECATFHVDYPQKYGQLAFLAARTVLPDGSTHALADGAWHDQPLAKRGKEVMRRVTFSLPSVSPGAILEYRYRVELTEHWSNRAILTFRLDWPAQRVGYYFRPLDLNDIPFEYRPRPRMISFHSPGAGLAEPDNGWHRFEAVNQPAAYEEPDMPPRFQESGWVMLYYTPGGTDSGERYWKRVAEMQANLFEAATSPDGDAKKLAAAICDGAADDFERAARLGRWMREHFTVVEYSEPDSFRAAGLKDVDQGRAALKQNGGSGYAAQLALATLARGAGMQAREVLAGDGEDFYFDPAMQDIGALPERRVALRTEGSWYVLDGAAQFLDGDMMRSREEGQIGFVCDRDSFGFVQLPVAGADRSRFDRVASLALDEDGGLRGEVHVSGTGHVADGMHRRYMGVTGATLDTLLRREVQGRFDDLSLQHWTLEPGEHGASRYALGAQADWPAVATLAGDRLVLQPLVFQSRRAPRYTAAERRGSIEFPYAWTETDSVRIRLPDGWKVESLQSRRPLVAPGLAEYSQAATLVDDGRTLVVVRQLAVGVDGVRRVTRDEYPGLKQLFDRIAELDRMSVTLVRR
ncbi:MAG: DUF3857 domain-containing protein [Candidatus Eisenbacteria bacterium]